jgi:hypothetical protein
MVIVNWPERPDCNVNVLELEVTVKSPTLTVILTVWTRPPGPVPVTIRVKVPVGVVAEVETVSVEIPDPPETRLTVDGDSDGKTPATEVVEVIVMVPARLFWLVRVMAAEPEEPRKMGRDCGLAEMLKSWAAPTFRVTTAVWDKGPSAPVTVIV